MAKEAGEEDITWDELIHMKERNVIPLNHNVGFGRLTQLFGRALYIKYFVKNLDPS